MIKTATPTCPRGYFQITFTLLSIIQLTFGTSDLIAGHLPNLSFPLHFRHYAGYLETGINSTHLFYWFFESTSSPTDPVILFLNGGPGCSSLYGAFSEIGPLRMTPNGSLQLNRHAWNQQANLLFLESPPGTGFSYRTNASGYWSNDQGTLQFNVAALKTFFGKYPHLSGNELYLTGQSYASHFIVQLANQLLNLPQFPVALRGIAIGNGEFVNSIDDPTFEEYLGLHGIFNYSWYPNPPAFTRPVWIYNLKRNCRAYSPMPYQYIYIPETPANRRPKATEPCGCEDALTRYLNDPAVRQAIHAVGPGPPPAWKLCAHLGEHNFHYADSQEFSLAGPIWNLLQHRIKVLLYNGDDDSICNYLATSKLLAQPPLHRLTPRGPKEFFERRGLRVFGTIQRYEQGLVRMRFYDAGHMVPTDSPVGALKMLNEVLLGRT